MSKILKICVSGAAGQIGYSILPMIASGRMFGKNTKIELNLLGSTRNSSALKGAAMELQDCAFPQISKIKYGSDPREMLNQVDLAILLGGLARQEGMQRKDHLLRNASIFKEQGEALNDVGKESTKVLVVSNPSNSNCAILSEFAPKIPKKNFTALTRLDLNRAQAQIATKAQVEIDDVKNIIIWGNHSTTQYPDINHGTINKIPISEVINDDQWIKGEFTSTVQWRGLEIIKARKLNSAMSAAVAAVDHIKDWFNGTPEGQYTSMAVISDGSYGIDKGLCYSFPVTLYNGDYQIVKGLDINEYSKERMQITKEELIDEREKVMNELI